MFCICQASEVKLGLCPGSSNPMLGTLRLICVSLSCLLKAQMTMMAAGYIPYGRHPIVQYSAAVN